MSNYNQLKNAAILTPAENTDLGSDTNRYSNVFMSGNIVMSNGVTVTSSNVITPKISAIDYPGDDTAADPVGGQTITINGTGFSNTASVLIGSTPATVVTVLSSTSITFVSPAMSAGTYAIYVINNDGGTAIYIPGMSYSGTPTWSTTAGTLATVYETNSINSTVAASSDSSITYSLFSGTLPTGSSLNTSSGFISGTAPSTTGTTTYTFTIRATDAQNQDTDRNFSITVNTDAVTWNSPADNTTTNLDSGSPMANVTMSATSLAGKSITYSANSLPTGITISGANITGTPTVPASTTSVITATAADSGRTATRTFNWVVSVASDALWMYTTMLLNGEGSSATNNATNNVFVDSSTNNFAVTKVSSPAQGSFSPYSASSWSNYFDGNGDYLSSTTLLNLSGNFTIECWVKFNTVPAGYKILLGLSNGSQYFALTGENTFEFYSGDHNAGLTSTTGTFQSSLTNTKWHHIVVCRVSGAMSIYLDGIKATNSAGSTNSYNGLFNTSAIAIGGYLTNATQSIDGYISNFRVVNGTAVYTSTFTPPTEPLTAISGTVLLTCQSNRFVDNSSVSRTFSIAGTPSVEKFSPFNGAGTYAPATYGGSVYVKGSNGTAGEDSLVVTMTGQPLGTGDFTIECWTYLENTGFINGGCVFSIADGGTNQMVLRPENDVYWRLTYNSGTAINMTPSPLVTGRWIHHAVVRISGNTKYYQNGILIGSGADTFNYTGTTLRIADYASYMMKGYISDFRIVKGTGVYTTSFTPPTQALTAITGTSVLLSFTNAGIIDQTGTNDIITIGDGSSKISTSVKKFGTGSISFGGTGGWVAPKQPNPLLRLGAGDWTFEFWLQVPNITQTSIWLVSWNADPRLQLNNATLAWYTAGTARITTGNVLVANTWQHVAVVKYNGSTKIYVDGTQSGGTYTDGNAYSTANMDAIGYNPFTGYVDEFRLTKGRARYTANFTPPTTGFSAR